MSKVQAGIQAQKDALERLIKIAALHDSGQASVVARFLLSWWNAGEQGGFDMSEIWRLDFEIRQDLARVFAFIARANAYPDDLGYGPQFNQIVKKWGITA